MSKVRFPARHPGIVSSTEVVTPAATGGRRTHIRIDPENTYRELAPAVLGYLRAQRARDPEDLLGEVFLQVTRDLSRFRGDRDDLRRWVFTIARNRLVDDSRRRARRPEIVDRELPDISTVLPADAPDPDLVRALALLTDDQREVIALRFIADLPLEEVARVTKRKIGAVKALQHRGLTTLARILTASADAYRRDDEPHA
jgi:RNA polymerase sigma factor (sigma-70 family)